MRLFNFLNKIFNHMKIFVEIQYLCAFNICKVKYHGFIGFFYHDNFPNVYKIYKRSVKFCEVVNIKKENKIKITKLFIVSERA